MTKKWDVYVYGDVNIDLVVPGVDALPAPGTEVDTPVMETFVGGGIPGSAIAGSNDRLRFKGREMNKASSNH